MARGAEGDEVAHLSALGGFGALEKFLALLLAHTLTLRLVTVLPHKHVGHWRQREQEREREFV
jgi:hypothetical protein